MRGRRVRGIGAALAVAALALASLPLLAPAAEGAGPAPALNPPIQWSAFNTGHVSVVLPGAFPQVELYETANASVRATLQIDGVFEIVPGGLPRPTVLADAFPTASAGFNATTPSNLSAGPVDLAAALEVRTTANALWGTTGPLPAAGADLGAASIDFRFSVLPAGSGVRLAWTVTNWPWVDPSDLLGIELHFTAETAPALAACTASSAASSSPCAGESLPARTIVWDSSLTRLEGVSPTGPVAAVDWTGGPSSYTIGAMATQNGSAEVILAAPSAPALAGGVDFTLATPMAPTAPAELRGSGTVYLATLGATGGAASLLILLYRRRHRRLLAEL